MKNYYFYQKIIILFLFLLANFIFISNDVKAQEETSDVEIVTNPTSDAYKAIVLIKSYIEDSLGNIMLNSLGSGVIIDENGLVITNHHVVSEKDEFDNTEKDLGYIICITEDISKMPDCSYSGNLIARNEDLDLALLQMEKIPDYGGKDTFDYLIMNTIDQTEVNDEVMAYGYPGIGDDTITITKGIISGKTNKHQIDWLKTDAVISFGSSGGAALDSEGKVIGITSSAHSDFLGSLGYIISVDSITNWLWDNKNKEPKHFEIDSKVIEFINRRKNLYNRFVNTHPPFTIDKPAEWQYNFEYERVFDILKMSDEDGGGISISIFRLPFIASLDYVEPVVKRQLSQFEVLSLMSMKSTITKIGNVDAKLIELSALGSKSKSYFVPIDNYIIEVAFDYGEDNKDKSTVENILNSFTVRELKGYTENNIYFQTNPDFTVYADDNWGIDIRNDKSSPLMIMHHDIPEVFGDIEVQKLDDIDGNDEFYDFGKQVYKEINILSSKMDTQIEILDSDAHYNLGGDLSDVIMFEYEKKSVTTGDIISQNIVYSVLIDGKAISASINYYSDNKDKFNSLKDDFKLFLENFSLKYNAENKNISDNKVEMEVKSETKNVINIINQKLHSKLKGKIMIKVEDLGKAYYINPSSESMYYLGRPDDAFQVMREQGVGINNIDLEKIPVAVNNMSGVDTDGDGLSDMFEDAIGTDKNKIDSDGDGFNDKSELDAGYSPKLKMVKINYDTYFSEKQKGKIFLQVEGKGEAWYINPSDGKRYFLGRPGDAYNVMRNLGLGISNVDFDSLQ